MTLNVWICVLRFLRFETQVSKEISERKLFYPVELSSEITLIKTSECTKAQKRSNFNREDFPKVVIALLLGTNCKSLICIC